MVGFAKHSVWWGRGPLRPWARRKACEVRGEVRVEGVVGLHCWGGSFPSLLRRWWCSFERGSWRCVSSEEVMQVVNLDSQGGDLMYGCGVSAARHNVQICYCQVLLKIHSDLAGVVTKIFPDNNKRIVASTTHHSSK